MAKFKPAGAKKPIAKPAPNRGLIPCAILALMAFAAIFAVMYFALNSSPPVSPAKTPQSTEKGK